MNMYSKLNSSIIFQNINKAYNNEFQCSANANEKNKEIEVEYIEHYNTRKL